MGTFILDTSGTVPFEGGTLGVLSWEGLGQLGGAFALGYTEALLATLPYMRGGAFPTWYGFRHLHRNTLAAIVADCAAYGRYFSGTVPHENGGHFWRNRQHGHLRNVTNDGVTRHYPPLAPYIGDDGKVRLREIQP